ncbi:peptidase M20 [Pseudalgibacter alginicilyticus]|uniref:Peptidase M20 n=1 Tax=Pseudalgibacter alginicilyticus TaxID=1736674 RepID=A0A0P0DCN1_9FLAO|nr:M28 family peptidase [Pseudalgibacter alginicilyticus]ALJ05754.1 peptidase M20 [Pseudalgibacter alginicilyticus]
MKRIFPVLLLIVVCVFNPGYAQIGTNDTILFSKTNLLNHLKILSSDDFEGRRTGTQGALKTRNYIVKQFQSLDILPLTNNYEQAFAFINEAKTYKGVNVLGLVKGTTFPNKYLVISAHYDHEGIIKGEIYNGADDNASGLSALFSFAEYFKNHPPKHSVILAAFDAEELGLRGSKYFVDHPIVPLKNIILNINMDMISRSDKNELYAVGTRFNMTLRKIVLNTETPENLKLLTGHDGADIKENWVYASDHASFHKKDIPFLYFGVEDHKDYHQPSDDYENIHPEFYTGAVKTIILVFQKIDATSF